MPGSRLLAILAALALVLTPATPADARPSTPVLADTRGQQVTLVTGDVVTVTETGGVHSFAVDPAPRPGAQPVTFAAEQHGDDYYVIPSDARRHLASGRVDRQLFNINALPGNGASIPVIVTYPGGGARALPATAKVRALPIVDGAAMAVDRRHAADFWGAVTAGGVAGLRLDEKLRLSLHDSVPQIGAPAAWQAGFDGSGVKVAVLDTGVDDTHPDLEGKVSAAKDFTGEGSAADIHGHGTHVAATIAGDKGVAPGANLISGRVCDAGGECMTSAILAGMDWAARSGARVINLSLGGRPTDGRDPLSQAVNKLTLQTGALFVIAAGNDGCPACVSTPAAADSALSVGAVDKSDALAAFSNRGPRLQDAAVKPEIVAPGVAIVAARAAGTTMGTPLDDLYTSASGTSMATPHVAGAAALLAQAHRGWRSIDFKKALVSTAKPVEGTVFTVGAGRVDVARALSPPVMAPAAHNFGAMTKTGTQVLTYLNTTAAPITLDVALELRSFSGQPMPAGVARLSTSKVVLAPHGTGIALLTISPHAAPYPGAYAGLVTATDGAGNALRTAVSFYKPTPTVPVSVRVLGFDGQPVPGEGYAVLGGSGSNPNDPFAGVPYFYVPLADGVGTIQVQADTYTAFTRVVEDTRAALVVKANTTAATITLDAREAVPSAVLVPGTEVVRHQMAFSYWAPDSSWTDVLVAKPGMTLYASPAAPVDGPAKLTVQDMFTLAGQDSIYTLNYSQPDGIPASLQHEVDPAQTATIRTGYHADVAELSLARTWLVRRRDTGSIMVNPTLVSKAPLRVTEYISRGDDLFWTRDAKLYDALGNAYKMWSHAQRAGDSEEWFEGPVAPTEPGFQRQSQTSGPDLFRATGMLSDSVAGHGLDVAVSGYPMKWRLWRDGVEIPSRILTGSPVPHFPMPDQAGQYRLESSLLLPATAKNTPSRAVRSLSPQVDTAWQFTSGKATGTACTPAGFPGLCDLQPLPMLGYELGLDLQNRAQAGVEHTFAVTVRHLRGAAIAGLTCSYSTDGVSWQEAPVAAAGQGRYLVTVPNPAGGEVWLRTEAWDGAGNRVTQTVQRAYAVH